MSDANPAVAVTTPGNTKRFGAMMAVTGNGSKTIQITDDCGKTVVELAIMTAVSDEDCRKIAASIIQVLASNS